jgi:Undecaprenyl-phosphate glucose phosphotransferase
LRLAIERRFVGASLPWAGLGMTLAKADRRQGRIAAASSTMANPAEKIRPPSGTRAGHSDPARRPMPVSTEVVSGSIKLLDFVLILAAAAICFGGYLGVGADGAATIDRYALTALLGAGLFIIGFQRLGGYDVTRLAAMRWQVTRVAAVWGAAVSALLLLAFVVKVSSIYSRGWALSWIVCSFGLLLVERSVLNLAIARWTREGRLARKVVVVGAGALGEQLIEKLQRSGDGSVAVLGVFDDRQTRILPAPGGVEVMGTTDDLLRFAREVPLDEVIVALPLSAEERLKMLFLKLRQLPVDLRLSAGRMADAFPVRGVRRLGGVPMIEIVDRPLKHWNAVAKRIEDSVLGAALLALLTPVMAVVALAIKLDSRGPVFFAQERFGFNNRVIRVLKFRTMHAERGDPSGAQRTVKNDPRITRIGRVLRQFSLDELPQLINVVRGEMSLVGPRPHAIMMKAGDRLYYDAVEDYLTRHRVKPGITGWAQVNGLRGEIDTLDKARQRVVYDLHYIEDWSLWFDLKILLMSLRVLLARQNAY